MPATLANGSIEEIAERPWLHDISDNMRKRSVAEFIGAVRSRSSDVPRGEHVWSSIAATNRTPQHRRGGAALAAGGH